MQALTEADESRRCAFVFFMKATKMGSHHAHFSVAANRLGFRGARHAETLIRSSFYLKSK